MSSQLTGDIVRDTAGNEAGIEGILRDITFRKHAEKALKESEERFRMISDLSPFPISIIDGSGNYLYVNNIFTQLFGYTLEDIPTEKEWLKMAFPDISRRKEAMLIWDADSLNSIGSDVRPCVFPVTCKDGSVCQINFFRTTLHGGEQFVVYEDLTPKKNPNGSTPFWHQL